MAGISTRAPIGQSIVTVYAKDQDSFGGVKYGIQSGNSLNGLQIGDNTGIIYNRILMADFISAGINRFNLVVNATDNQLSDTTNVLVFIPSFHNVFPCKLSLLWGMYSTSSIIIS